MSEASTETDLTELLDIRRPGAHLDAKPVNDEFALSIGVDVTNYQKFARVDDGVTYPKDALDIRDQVDFDSGAELPDYSGPYRPDLRLTDFSVDAFASRILPWSAAYLQLCVDGWADEVSRRYGSETMAEIEWAAWTDQVEPEIERMRQEFLPTDVEYTDPNTADGDDRIGTRIDYAGLFSPRPGMDDRTKPELVNWLLGSHEFLLQCIEAWATQLTVRYGLDAMFDIQFTLWGDVVLPGAKGLKERYLGISGDTVADWMKDLQLDATALPGKAFDVSFEMPAPDVGIMTFNRCVAVDQWEAMGRPDILEKNCHSTCPKSMIVTTEMYNPNMKVEIMAIPPRRDPDDVCCKWRFTIDPDEASVPVQLGDKSQSGE